ncbi:hypothetical protein PICST_59570 [Scheffersomyces stipitis CBS 6054]|uniref:Uncharacterized protein n=1 Tax=Scheffersomyces stipitis (strain ATCC 58785 / CBS 6054 / NBRC 10063 / NRRL Y-11545) TaxID=322104 RepID=A3LUJ8_PICST|nr:hypothetical protein PICST_59570 [Scheffersomyces stipitis CBS 6054]ABN66602.2 hypothetical protein PICST_59570 [Scheffersomyces stipitis CBS 6054]
MSTQHLSQDSLFVCPPTSPPSSNTSILHLVKSLQSESIGPNYASLLDQTYHLIRHPGFSQSQLLRLWHLRLVLHLFNNRLNYAKKEAINLNNALYLHENNNAVPPNSASLATSDSASTTASATTNVSRLNTNNLTPIYPLPKNNWALIDYDLLILLLRLKSLPNLNLINEIYKLNYQLRLKSSSELKHKLINLSYDIVVVLLITKNYLSLLNYLINLRQELKLLPNPDEHYQQYLSNVTLLIIIVETLVLNLRRKSTPDTNVEELVIPKYKDSYESEVQPFTKNSLLHSMQTLQPTIPSQDSEITETPAASVYVKQDITLEELVDSVINGSVTTRIICSTLGLWELCNIFPHFKLESSEDGKLQFLSRKEKSDVSEEQLQEFDHDQLLDLAYADLNNHWYKYIYKIYGLE